MPRYTVERTFHRDCRSPSWKMAPRRADRVRNAYTLCLVPTSEAQETEADDRDSLEYVWTSSAGLWPSEAGTEASIAHSRCRH